MTSLDESTILTEPVDELPISVVESRLADIFLRNPAAISMYRGGPDDLESEIDADIIRAAFTCRDKQIPGGVSIPNIAELSGIPEKELRTRSLRARSDIMAEFDVYQERILAESYRRKMLTTLSSAHAQMARTKWRDAEKVGSNVIRSVGTVTHTNHVLGENDAGNVLRRIREHAKVTDVPRPIALPWAAVNRVLEEGLRPHKKLYIVAPPGSRKTTILYNIMLHMGLNGYRYMHFALDGGSIQEQVVKITAILWYKLLIENNVKPDVMVDTGNGYQDYMFARKRTIWKLLADEDPGFDVPPDALELFWMSYDIMNDLTRTGKSSGRITFVSPKECRGDIATMRNILNAEFNGDGIDIWGFDHLGKLMGRSGDPMTAVHETVMYLHTFTDQEGPPMISAAHMNQESIRDIGKNRAGLIQYGSKAEQDTDYMFLSMFDPKSPTVLPLTTPKNRDEGAANPILHIQPESGYIYEVNE